MRILHVIGSMKLPRDPDTEGASGAVNVALGIAQAQVKLGHEVWVAAVDHDAWRTEWRGINLVRVKLAPWAHIQIGNRHLDFRVQLPLIALTRRYDFDVIQGCLHYYLRFLRAKIRVVNVQIDPLYSGDNTQDMSMQANDFAVIARSSDAQVAASGFVAKQLQRGLGSLGDIHVVYNGVDNDLFDADRWQGQRQHLRQAWGMNTRDIAFLYAGAIVPEKGVLNLARAFAQLSERHPALHLIIAGSAALWNQSLTEKNPSDSYEAEVRAVLHPSLIRGQVHFLGKVTRSDMPAIYAASDAVIVPSVWNEAFGLVALEALATSRPVIASATGALPELINATNGFLVAPGDESAIERALLTLASDPDLRLRLSRAGRIQAAHFTWEEAAQVLDGIYAKHLHKKGWHQQCAAL